jgi:hypothetical protein
MKPPSREVNGTHNRILGLLPSKDSQRLRKHMKLVELPLGKSLYDPFLFLPQTAVLSLRGFAYLGKGSHCDYRYAAAIFWAESPDISQKLKPAPVWRASFRQNQIWVALLSWPYPR